MKWLWIVLLLPSIVQSFFDKNVKYMPMGYEKEPKCPEIPPKKSKSSFNVWQFLATISLTSTIAANIVNNVNSNNNNNNNNNNQDSQNTINQNTAMNMNSNMNMNMLMMALGRQMPTPVSDCLLTYVCQKIYNTNENDDFIAKFLSIFGGYAILDHKFKDYKLESLCSNTSCTHIIG